MADEMFFFVFSVDKMVGSWIFSSGKLVDLMVVPK